MQKKKLFSFTMAFCSIILLVATFPLNVFAKETIEDPNPLEGIKFTKISENASSFRIEEGGKTYEYVIETLNANTKDTKVRAKKYSVSKDGKKTLLESSTASAHKESSAYALAGCHGVTGSKVSWAGTRYSLYLSSCITKKIVNVINETKDATSAIAGIGAVLITVAKFVPYVSAISGALWAVGAGFRAISGDGKYGIGFHFARNPFTGEVIEGIGVPWRQ
ncbi:hypothetical protein BTA31_01645 [Bacillus haynesii]|uniref:Uncharacterized protein n=1 Tax=Bacillus haynesii TaxID=1925021 RepID=A0ABX3I8A0_9BACI|nr:hypothetical protein [Bacillus haynesii]OMI30293.1 hypothetical protein BTA31_01645 [Bacillus haynesii]